MQNTEQRNQVVIEMMKILHDHIGDLCRSELPREDLSKLIESPINTLGKLQQLVVRDDENLHD